MIARELKATPLDAQFGVYPQKSVPQEIADTEPFSTDTLFAILDAARIFGLPEMLENSDAEFRCIFAGRAAEDFKDAAPYLVHLKDSADVLRTLTTRAEGTNGWWDACGTVLLQSTATLDELTRHLRTFTYIRDGGNRGVYLRFWDPKILSALFAAASDAFTDPLLLFGQRSKTRIDAFWIPDPSKDTMHLIQTEEDQDGRPLYCSDQLMAVLRDAAKRSFALTLADHCRTQFPAVFQRLDDAAQTHLMLGCIHDAARFNVTKRGPVTSFAEMKIVLGTGMADDPMYPWVAACLQNITPQTQMSDSEALTRHFTRYITTVCGPENKHFVDAVRRARARLDAPRETSYPDMLQQVYPEKCAYLEPDAVTAFLGAIRQGMQSMNAMGHEATRAFVLLCFFMGHRCAEDPQYDWIGQTLARDTAERDTALVGKARVWTDAFLEKRAA